MSFFREQYARDLANVFFNPDERAELILWDDDEMFAIVSDDQKPSEGFEGSRELRKVVDLQRENLLVKPESGDQIKLDFDPMKAGNGDLWTVDSVAEPPGRYRITLTRYAS